MGLTATLGLDAYPFYLGSVATSTVVPKTITLDGRLYAIDASKYRRQSQETLRDGVVQSAEPNDVLFNANGAWARYRYSWFHGADQEFADLRDDADPYRFSTSRGVNVWNDHELTLLPSTKPIMSAASTNPLICVVDSYLFYADGANLYRTSDLITFTTCTVPGGTIQCLSTDGTDLYVATTTVMVKYVAAATAPTAFATPVTGNCTQVAFVANRLIVGTAQVLYEVAAAGTLTTLVTHFQSAFRWTAIFAVGSRIYVGGFCGSRSELYTLAVDATTGALYRAQDAAPFPAGELLRAGYSYAGAVVLCTSKGVRFAELGGDATLTYGPLIDDVGDSRCATADGRYAWVGWSAFSEAGSGLARLALDTFVNTLQPAYASDVVTRAQKYVTLDGSDDYLSTPDSAGISITGDIEVACRVRLTDYTGAATQFLVCHGTTTGDIGWRLHINTSGKLGWVTAPDGTAFVTTVQTAAAVFVDNTTYWIKATLDVVNGANRVAVFYYAADAETEPSSWTTIETVTTAGATSIFNSTAVGSIGGSQAGTSPCAGRIYRTIVRNGIAGTVVADFNAADATTVAASTVTSLATGEVWTLNGDAVFEAITAPTGTVTSVARFGGRTLFAVSSSGLWVDSATRYMTDGWLESGITTFGTVEHKIGTSMVVRMDPLVSGQTVGCSVLEHPSATSMGSGTMSAANDVELTLELDGDPADAMTVRLTLAGTGASTPTLNSWRLRAYPVVPPVQQWVVPLLLHSAVKINNGEGQAYSQIGVDELDSIVETWKTKTAITYAEGTRAYRVRVDAYEYIPEGWNSEGDFFEGILNVRLVEA